TAVAEMPEENRIHADVERLRLRMTLPVEYQFVSWIWDLLCGLTKRRATALEYRGIDLYVRGGASHGFPSGNHSFDIAKVQLREELRGKGWFRQFLALAERLNPWEALYVENVRNPQLQAMFHQD